MTRIVTGLFQQRRDADLVVEHLVQEFDVPRERIQIHATDDSSGEEARSAQDDDQEASLPDLGLPDDALRACGDGIRRGGILVAAWVDDNHVGRAVAACREYGAAEPQAHEVRSADAAGGREQRIRTWAYLLWEREGRPEGRDLEFWDRARRAIEEETAKRAPREFAGETGAAPLPEQDRSPEA